MDQKLEYMVSYFLHWIIFCLGIYMYVIKPSIYFWKRFCLRFLVFTVWKVPKYGVISVPCFPVFESNTEIYFVNLHIQSEYRKMRTRNNFAFGYFSSSVSSSHYCALAPEVPGFSQRLLSPRSQSVFANLGKIVDFRIS